MPFQGIGMRTVELQYHSDRCNLSEKLAQGHQTQHSRRLSGFALLSVQPVAIWRVPVLLTPTSHSALLGGRAQPPHEFWCIAVVDEHGVLLAFEPDILTEWSEQGAKQKDCLAQQY
jgi:hypothetical protein